MGLNDWTSSRIVVRTILRTALALAVVGFIVVALAVPAAQPAQASAGINQTINFQGRLLSNSGAVVADGNYNMRFKIYQDGDGVLGGGDETLKWTETRQNSASLGVAVKNGYFSVNLGSVTAFGTSVDWNQDTLWLSMDVAGTGTGGSPTYDGEMSPFKRLASAVYALNSYQLGGLTSGQFVQLAQGIQTASLSSNPAIGINATSGSNNLITLQSSATDVFDVTSTGNLQFGNNADKTINVATAASGNNGNTLTLQAGSGNGTDKNGGNLLLQGGNSTGTGTPGSVIVKPQTDNTAAFQVQTAGGAQVFGVDTTGTPDVVVGQYSSGTTQPTFLYLSDVSSNSGGKALLTGNWASPANWGIGPNSNSTTDSVLRIGTTGSVNSNTWSNSANVNLLVTGTETITPTSGNDSNTALRVQNSSNSPILNVDTSSGQVTIGNTPGSVQEDDAHGTNQTTVSDAPHATGNLMMLGVIINGTSGATVSSVSGGGVSTWSQATAYTDSTNNVRYEIWKGAATSTGAGTITVSYSTTPGAVTDLAAQEFTAGSGASWSVASAGNALNGSSSTVTFPALTNTTSSQLYWGIMGNQNAGAAGSTAGFSYGVTGYDNLIGYGSDLAAGSHTPTASQSPAGWSSGAAVIMSLTNTSNALTVSGSTTITGTNSNTAFQVQNAGGSAALTVDTTNSAVNVIGKSAAPTHVNTWHANSASQSTLSVSPATTGNLMALAIRENPGSFTVTSVSGGGVSNWHLVKAFSNSVREEIWEGTVTSTGSSTITATYSSTLPATDIELWADEFTAGLGAGTNWFVTSTATVSNGASTTLVFPSLTATQTNGVYFGYMRNAGSSSATGCTSGFTCTVTGPSNLTAYSTSMVAGTTYAPSTTGNSNAATEGVAMIIAPSVGGLNVDNNLQVGGTSTFNGSLTLQGSSTYITNPQYWNSSEAFGNSASVTNTNATAVGNTAQAGFEGTAVGNGASAGQQGVAVGHSAAGFQYSTAVGESASTTSYYSVAAGAASVADEYATAVGYSTYAYNTSTALGYKAKTFGPHQFVVGSNVDSAYIQDTYFGSGIQDSSPVSTTIHATGACSGTNAQCGSGSSNLAGASLSLAGGIGTGTGNGGNVNLQVAKPGSSGSSANSLATVASLSGANGAALFQNSANSTTGFQVANAAGNGIVTVDTTNGTLSVKGQTHDTSASALVVTDDNNNGLVTARNDGKIVLGKNASSGSTVGYTTIGSSDDSGFGGLAIADKFTTGSIAPTVNSISFYVSQTDQSPNHAVVGIYTDSSNSPDSLLVSSTSTAITTGWNTINVSYSLSANTTYWFGVEIDSVNGATHFIPFDAGAGTNHYYKTGVTYGTLPSTYGSPSGSSSAIHSIYANVTESGALTTLLTVDPSNGVSVQTPTNMATAFQVQNAAGNQILTVDTSGAQVVLGKPSTVGGKLVFDDAGSANTGTLQLGGTLSGGATYNLPTTTGTQTICTSATASCSAAGSGYIVNGTSTQTGNFNIQSNSSSSVGAVIQGASSQTADLLDLRDSTSANVLKVDSAANMETTGYFDNGIGGIGPFSNLLECSEQFDAGCTGSPNWTVSSVTAPTANTDVAPDGNTTAESLADSGSGGSVSQTSGTAPTNANYTFSVWLKTTSGTQAFALRIDGATTGTGTACTGTAHTTWERFSCTQNTNGFTGNIMPMIFPGGTGGSGTVRAWGGQLVLGSTPQVYVRTTTGTVAATTGVVSNGGVYAVSQNTNDVPLVVQGYASQSGNLLNFKNASGSAIAGVSAAGNFFTASSYDQNNNSTLLIGNANATAITLGKSASNILTTISGTALVKPTSGNDSTTAFQVQTAGGLSLLSADSTNSIINTGNAVAPTYVNDWHANSTNQATLSVSPATQGNLMALAIEANNTGTRVASVSGGGVSAWHLVTYNSGTAHEELWEGTVTSTGASSITVTYIATPGASCDLDAQEFTAGLGANTNWFVTNSNTINNSASTTITYPSLRASETNGLYWGYARSAGTGSAGSTSGFSYTVTGASNVVTYNPTMTSGSTYQPTASNTNNSSDAVAMIVMASISSLNVIGSSQLSGNVTSPVVFGAASNMQGAFQIQNASGVNAFNVDTANNLVTSADTLKVGPGSPSTATPKFLYVADVTSNAAGNAQITGQWDNSNNWGIGANSNSTSDNALRLGVTTANGGNTWSTSQNLNVVAAGTLKVQPTTSNDSTTAFQVQNAAGTSTIFNVDTSATKVTVATTAAGGAFINNGATLNSAKDLGNLGNGAIGTAAATVDIYTTFTIPQTTSSISVTIPSPTDTTAGRQIYIANTGSVPLTVAGITLSNGSSMNLFWNGSAWTTTAVSTGVSIVGGYSSSNHYNDGASISGNTITLGAADATHPGLIDNGSQTFAGDKTLKSSSNSASAFQVKNSDGESVFQTGTTQTVNGITNYIADSEFALGSGSCPLTDWTVVGSPTTCAQNTTAANSYAADTSLQLVTTTTSGQGITTSSFTSSPATATSGSGQYYTVSFYAEQTSGTPLAGSNLQVQATTSGGSPTSTCTIAGQAGNTLSSTGFEQVVCTLNFASASNNPITALAITTTGSNLTADTVYISNVQLQLASGSGGTVSAPVLGQLNLRGVITSPVAMQTNANSSTAMQIQNAAGNTILNVNTNNTNINTSTASTTGVSSSAPSNVNAVLQSTYSGTPGASSKTLGVSPHALGNVMILTIAMSSNTLTTTSVSGGGVTNWVLVNSKVNTNQTITTYMYEGTVTSTGASNITVNFSATDNVATELVNNEFSSGLGSNTVWGVTASNWAVNTSNGSTTIPFPTLTSGTTGGGLYYAYSALSSTARIDPGTPGFHWFQTPSNSNAVGYKTDLTPNTSYTPVQLANAGTYADTIGVIMTPMVDNSVGINGATLITGANSAAAFQVQNAAGAADLNVDTANNVISLLGGNTGDIAPWQYNSDSTGNSGGEGHNVAVTANGYVYDLTGNDAGSVNGKVYYGKAQANGPLGHMSQTTTPGTTLEYQGAVVVNGYVYELGGYTGSGTGTNYKSLVQFARINPDGTLGTWGTTTALPAANGIAGASVVTANGYIYVMGGFYDTGGGAVMSTAVYYGKVNADGTVSSWTTSANALPVALRFASAVYVNGNILFMGGGVGSSNAVATVYTTSLNSSTGANGTFCQSSCSYGTSSFTNASLPGNRVYASAYVANGYVYVVGGSTTDPSMNPTNTTYYGQINSAGYVPAWSTSAQSLPQTEMWQGGVVLNGYLYVIGGVYTTGGATSASTFYASTARVLANASLDLVGPTGSYMSDGGDQSSGSLGGMLTAGNTNIVGTLQVAGQASFNQSATVNGNLNTFGQSVFKTTTNSTTAFQIQNSSGADLLNADTTNAVTDLTNNANNNLVTNGSGEVNATGWAAVGSSGTPAQDTTERYIGTGSIKTTTTAAANDGMKYSLTTSTLVSNTQYTLTLFAKLAPGTTMATFEIGRAENGSTFSQCLTAQTITGAGWTKFNCSFTTGTTSSTPFIYVRQTDATVRTIYVDGVQLTRWSLLANASVEQTLTASDWVKKGNASDAVSKDATQFYDSANSLKIITTANAGDGTKNNITLNDSTYYTLTFQARLDTASAAMATMEAGYSYDGGTTEDACITAQTVVSSGWTSYTCGFTTRSSHSGTPYFYIKQTDGAVHTFYIDAVQLAIGNPLNSAYVEGTISLNGTISSPVALQNQSNSTSAFNVQNSTGNTLLVADTSTMGLTVNSATITATMSVRADATKTVTTAYTTAASSSLTIPNDVTSVTVYSWAAGGGGAAGSGGGSDTAGGNGGGGGYAKAVVSVNPGESLTIEVGTGGAKAGAASKGGNGGGYSAVKRSTTYLVQAGGGGGGGGAQGTVGAGGNGGVGGGATGGNGTAGAGTATNGGLGSGGSASAGGGGGSAGSSGVAGAAGAANVGGEGGGAVTNCSTAVTTGGVGSSFGGPGKGGDQASCDGGGGGGGGAYGGGGGGSATNTGNHAAGGGGGGSDLLTGSSTADASGSGTTHATGDTTAYASCPSTAGNGGSGNKAFGSATAGTDGCVIITYATATNHTSALNVETSAGTDVLRVAANGTTLFKNSGDSNVALQVQNSSGSQVFDVDTTNQKTIAKQNSSSYNSPVMSLQQAGSGDAILEMQDATDGFYLGVNSANAHSFNINSRDALSSSSNIIGEDFTVDPDNFDDSNASSVMATRFTASTTGTISSINVGFNSGTGGALYSVGIFSDNGSPSNCSPNPSCPGTLIGYHSGTAAISAPGGGINWNNLSIIPVSGSSVPVTAGTTYWLAFQTDSSGPDYPNYCNSTTYAAYRSGITGPNLGTWGDWTTIGTTDLGGGTCEMGVYASIVNTSSDSFSNSLFNLTTNGAATYKNLVNSASAFAVQNSRGMNMLTVDTTNSRVYVGAAASNQYGDVYPVELVTHNTDVATDPTGVNGAIYYNTGGVGGANSEDLTHNGKFRCYEEEYWKNCIGMRDIEERRWGYLAPISLTANLLTAFGIMTAPTPSGGAADKTNAESYYAKFTTAATTGTSAGEDFNVANTEGQWGPKVVARVRVDGSNVSQTRDWVGMVSTSEKSSNGTGSYAAIRYSNGTGGSGDTNWMCATNGGGASDTGVAVTAGHYYDMIIDMTLKTTLICSISDNGGAFQTVHINTTPTGTTDLGLEATVTALSNSARSLSVAYMFLEQN